MIFLVFLVSVFSSQLEDLRLFMKGLTESYLPRLDSSACLDYENQKALVEVAEKIYYDVLKNQSIRIVVDDFQALQPLLVSMVVECHIGDVLETSYEIFEERGIRSLAANVAMNYKWIELRFQSYLKAIDVKNYQEAGVQFGKMLDAIFSVSELKSHGFYNFIRGIVEFLEGFVSEIQSKSSDLNCQLNLENLKLQADIIEGDILRCLKLDYDFCLKTSGDLGNFNRIVEELYSSCEISELKDDLLNLEDPSQWQQFALRYYVHEERITDDLVTLEQAIVSGDFSNAGIKAGQIFRLMLNFRIYQDQQQISL